MPRAAGRGGRSGGRHGGGRHGGRHRGHGFSGRIGPVRYRFKGFRKRIHQHTLRFTVKGVDVALGGKVDLENRQIKGGHFGIGARGVQLNATQGREGEGHRLGGTYRGLEVSHVTGSGKTLVHLGPFEAELSRSPDGTVNVDIAQEPLRQYLAEMIRDYSLAGIQEQVLGALQGRIEEFQQMAAAKAQAAAEAVFTQSQQLVQEGLEGAQAATEFALRSAHLAATAGPADLALGAEYAAYARIAATAAAEHAAQASVALTGMASSAVLLPIEHETAVNALDLGITQMTAARALAAEAAEAAESVLLFLL